MPASSFRVENRKSHSDQETLINQDFIFSLSSVRSELSAILSRSSAHFSKPFESGTEGLSPFC